MKGFDYIENIHSLPFYIFFFNVNMDKIIHVHSNSYVIFLLLLLFGIHIKILQWTLHNQRIAQMKPCLK